MTSTRIHITTDLEQIIRSRIVKLEALPLRQPAQEGELIAYREVLRLAFGGIKE